MIIDDLENGNNDINDDQERAIEACYNGRFYKVNLIKYT